MEAGKIRLPAPKKSAKSMRPMGMNLVLDGDSMDAPFVLLLSCLPVGTGRGAPAPTPFLLYTTKFFLKFRKMPKFCPTNMKCLDRNAWS